MKLTRSPKKRMENMPIRRRLVLPRMAHKKVLVDYFATWKPVKCFHQY